MKRKRNLWSEPGYKLTFTDVRNLRHMFRTLAGKTAGLDTALAERFHVTVDQVEDLRAGKTWKWLGRADD